MATTSKQNNVALASVTSFFGHTSHGIRDEANHFFFALDQFCPVKFRFADLNAVGAGNLNLVQGMSGGDKNLLGGAAAVGAGAAKILFLNKRDFFPSSWAIAETPKPAFPPPRMMMSYLFAILLFLIVHLLRFRPPAG
jgi:hypothetical protein